MSVTLAKVPYGMRDFLPQDASAMRKMEASLRRLFFAWGFDEVRTPTVAYLDTLTRGSHRHLESQVFQFFDVQGQSLALRHEMTTPIARLCASRLAEAPRPLKLCYVSDVFRRELAQAGRQCSFRQAGAELVGESSPNADAEVLALAIASLQAVGLQGFQVFLGHVGFAHGLMLQLGLSDEAQAAVKTALERHDFVTLAQIAQQHEGAKALAEIPFLRGQEDALQKAETMAANDESVAAIADLRMMYCALKNYGLEAQVCFDFGLIRDFDYYTGMVFEAYAPKSGYPVCGGGRYDQLLENFGLNAPATGFALGVERVLLARERQGMQPAWRQRDVYLAYAENKETEAVFKAKAFRAEGQSVFLALHAESRTEAQEQQAVRHCHTLCYLS